MYMYSVTLQVSMHTCTCVCAGTRCRCTCIVHVCTHSIQIATADTCSYIYTCVVESTKCTARLSAECFEPNSLACWLHLDDNLIYTYMYVYTIYITMLQPEIRAPHKSWTHFAVSNTQFVYMTTPENAHFTNKDTLLCHKGVWSREDPP